MLYTGHTHPYFNKGTYTHGCCTGANATCSSLSSLLCLLQQRKGWLGLGALWRARWGSSCALLLSHELIDLARGQCALLQVVDYLQPLLSSIEAPVVFEAAAGILALADVSEGALAAAPTLAMGALVDLWDHEDSGAARAQIMDALTRHLSSLQV